MTPKHLFLMRHAEATPPSIYQLDEKRALTAAGARAAVQLGVEWNDQGIRFDKIVASPALRTQLTARLVAKEVSYELRDIVTVPVLYEGTATTVVEKMQT